MPETGKNTGLNFKTLFEASPSLFLILQPNTPHYTILAVSNAYLKATRTEREKIHGRSLFEVFPDNPDDQTASTNNLLKSLNHALDNKESHAITLHKSHIRGTEHDEETFEERYWNMHNTPVLNENEEVLYLLHKVEDITEVVHLNNKSTEEIIGARAEIKEKSAFIKNNQQRINSILDTLVKYTAFDFSQQIVLEKQSDGLDKIANSLNILSKELQNHIQQVEEANLQLQSVIESYKDVLIFSINKKYEYLIFNSAFKDATYQAYGTQITVGMSMLDSIKNEEDKNKAKENCDKAFNGEPHIKLEIYGSLLCYYYETRYTPMVDDKGEIVGVTIMSANVTERKRAEEQLLELNKELESFSYSVSHDLRAPLRAVNGYAQILEEDFGKVLGSEGNRLLEVIQHNAKKMGTLIDDLLAFSRLGKKELKKTDLNMNELVEAALYEINKSTIHHASIKIENLHPVKGDYGLINQVVVNLLENAIKYSSKVKTPIITVSSEKINDRIIYTVKDNGAGFDMKYADKLFGVFQRLHGMDEFEGTGVGLAIVQRIMAKHGGEVLAEGETDKGATFKFLLPLN